MSGREAMVDRPSPRGPTLTSLARELGVHVSTVSRALSDSPHGIAPDTVQLVRELASRRGYRHNAAARSLRTGRSLAVGMTVPRLTDQVLATVYAGVDETAIAAGYTTLVSNTHAQPELRRQRVDLMMSRQVDGVVVADSRQSADLLVEMEASGVPYVLALRRLPGHLSISTDDLRGGRLAAEHLLELGHTHIGIVAGDTRASTGRERTQGFLEACSDAGVEIPASHVQPCLFDVRSGAVAAGRLLAAAPDVTAIFAASDNVALGVIGTLRSSGRQVPDDVALVGYNDLDLASALPVPLTSVDSRLLDVGRSAMSTLLDRINGNPVESRLLTPRLVVRASTLGPGHAQGRHGMAAVEGAD